MKLRSQSNFNLLHLWEWMWNKLYIGNWAKKNAVPYNMCIFYSHFLFCQPLYRTWKLVKSWIPTLVVWIINKHNNTIDLWYQVQPYLTSYMEFTKSNLKYKFQINSKFQISSFESKLASFAGIITSLDALHFVRFFWS